MLGRAHRTPASAWMEGPLRGMPPRLEEQVSFATAQQGVVCVLALLHKFRTCMLRRCTLTAAAYVIASKNQHHHRMQGLCCTNQWQVQDSCTARQAASGRAVLGARSLETSVGVGVFQSLPYPSGGACCLAGGINAERAGSGDSLASLPKLQPVHRLAKPDLKIVQRIGEGAFGEVSVAKAPLYGTVAVKWLKVRVQVLQQVAVVLHLRSRPIPQ